VPGSEMVTGRDHLDFGDAVFASACSFFRRNPQPTSFSMSGGQGWAVAARRYGAWAAVRAPLVR